MNTTSATTKSTTASKTVQVIARYFIKATFAVIYLIMNGSGKRCLVTMNANGTSGCEEIIPAHDGKPETTQQCEACKHGRDCYHKLAVFAIEGARGLHVQEHGTLAGFRFVAPEVVPMTVEEVVSFHETLYNMTPSQLQEALSAMKLSELKELAKDRHVKSSGKKAMVVSALLADYAESHELDARIEAMEAKILAEKATEVSAACPEIAVELPELPTTEEEAFNDEPLSAEEAALFEQVGNEEIVLQDELHEAPKEPTRAQVISSIRHGVQQLVDFDPDYATNDNGMGPNGTDTIFMHAFSDRMNRDEPIPVKKWVSAAQKLQKYNRTQLGGIIPPMPVVEKALLGTSIEACLAARGLMR